MRLKIALLFTIAHVVTGPASRAAAQPVTESFTYQGRTLLYRYDPADLPGTGRPPGLLLYFHGNKFGSQEYMLDFASRYKLSIAKGHGLVGVALASPAFGGGRLGGVGTRHWYDEDIPLIHEFLQTELPSQFVYDSNRIVFWGVSQGTCFLNDFIVRHGTSYGGGLLAQCGCFNRDPQAAWETPPDFKNRFKVVVQATTGDFLHWRSVSAYWFYKYEASLPTLGDLSEEGDHCSGRWAVAAEDAIGWLLDTRNTAADSLGRSIEPRPPWLLAERSATGSEDCIVGDFVHERHGDGDPLWLAVKENGELEVPTRNAERYLQIETVAGSGESGYAGDGGPATEALLASPTGVAVGADGSVYVADRRNHRVRRIDAGTGVITTVAGTGQFGYAGDGGPATEALLANPTGVAVGADGSVYVADAWNGRVRRIDAGTGVITTVAGAGRQGFLGDGGSATEARLRLPSAVAVDAAGNLFVTEETGARVRRVDAATGVITTVAGTGEWGFSGDGGPATDARLNSPSAVAVDAAGNLFVTDSYDDRLRRVDAATGVITTVPGFGHPYGVAVDTAGNLFVADYSADRLRRVDAATGVITTVAGTGATGYLGDGGPATRARLDSPSGVAVDAAGRVYVTSIGNHTLRVLRPRERVVVPLGQSGEAVRLEAAAGGLLTLPTREREPGEPLFEGAQVEVGNGDTYALTQAPDGTIAAAPVVSPPTLRISTSAANLGSIVETFAGTGEFGYAGDGGPATEARLCTPTGLAADAAGNLFIADQYVHAVRRVDAATGVITTVAGTSWIGYTGDGGPATQAQLSSPTGVAVDAVRNVYVADRGNDRVRRIDAGTGVITTVAGTGEWGFSGDGGPATDARLNSPTAVAVDAAGNLFVADSLNQRVRRVDAETGVITTVAGTGTHGYTGDGGPATNARLWEPIGVAVDAAGNLFVADSSNERVRRVDAETGVITTIARSDQFIGVAVDAVGNLFVVDSERRRVRRIDAETGVITTVVGTGRVRSAGDGGPETEARLWGPIGVAVDAAGNLFLADSDSRRVGVLSEGPYHFTVQLGSSGERRVFGVSRDGDVYFQARPVPAGQRIAACSGNVYALTRTAAGGLAAAYLAERQAVGLGIQAPVTLERDESGAWRLGGEVVRSGHQHRQGGRDYVLDRAHGRWRLASHVLRTVGGHSGVADEIPAASARLYSPSAVAFDSQGSLYLADRKNHRVRRIDASGMIATLAGTGDRGYGGDDGPAAEALLDSPADVAVGADGSVYLADTGNQRVRRIDTTGTITTFAGTGVQGFAGDGGAAVSARLDNPLGVAVDAAGIVYVADYGNRRVRRIGLAGGIETYAGAGSPSDGSAGDGGPASEALLDGPAGVAVDVSGNLYIAEYLGRRVRRVGADGVIATVAGTGEAGSAGDGGPASEALLDGPAGVAVDVSGNLYIAEYLGRRVRRVGADGVIATVAGTGEAGSAGDGGPASEALLDGPAGVAAGGDGSVFVADSANHRIRRVDATGSISTFAGTGEPFARGDGSLASLARFSDEIGAVAVDASGNVYVADRYDHSVRRIDAAEMASTFAGTGTAGFWGDGGPAAAAGLNDPSGLAADAAGNVYVADTGNHRLRRVDAAGMVTTVAGTGEAGYSGEDYSATSSKLNSPKRTAVDAGGNVYVLDSENLRVRVIKPTGRIWTLAGNGEWEDPAIFGWLSGFFDGRAASLVPLWASELAVGPDDPREGFLLHLVVGEPESHMALWSVSLEDPRIHARLGWRNNSKAIVGLAVGATGTVYLATSVGVFAISPDGSVSTVADLDEYGISVGGLAVDELGRVWLSDPEHRRVRVLKPLH